MIQKNIVTHTINVTFWLRKVGKHHIVYCAISIDGNREAFSTKVKVNKEKWCSIHQRIKNKYGKVDTTHPDNTILDQHYNNIKTLFLQLCAFEMSITAHNLRNYYLNGTKIEKVGVLEYAKRYVEQNRKLAGKSIAKTTFKRIYQWFNRFANWVKDRNYQALLLSEVRVRHFNDFIQYELLEASFKNHGKHKIGYENEIVQKDAYQFKKLLQKAFEEELIEKNILRDVVSCLPKKHKEIIFLESWELDKMERYTFASERLQQVADLFIFQCYTGFAYCDAVSFDESKDTFIHNDKQWICKERAKTGSQSLLPFFNNAKIKYRKGLHFISNGKYNQYLKEIAAIVGINKRLTTHTARKTAAMLFLENGCDLETIAKMCGHLNTSVTKRHYTRIRVNRLETQIPTNQRLQW